MDFELFLDAANAVASTMVAPLDVVICYCFSSCETSA